MEPSEQCRVERQWVEFSTFHRKVSPSDLESELGTVEARLRDGTILIGLPTSFDWRCTFGDKDIMAYRKYSGTEFKGPK